MAGRGHAAWRRIRLPALGLALLLATAGTHAAVLSQQEATVAPTARAPPVTLSAVALTGTSVNAQTVATTTGIIPLLGATSTLTLARAGSQSWDARIAVTAASGVTGAESLVVALVGGGTQAVTVQSATAFPQVSAALALGAGGLTATVATLNVLAGCHSCTVQAELRFTPAGGTVPAIVYPYTITTGL